MKIAKAFAVALWVAPLAAVSPATAHDTPMTTQVPPPQDDQVKQLGQQLLMSLFARVVKGEPKPPAAPVPTEALPEGPAVELAVDSVTPQEPAVEVEPQPALR